MNNRILMNPLRIWPYILLLSMCWACSSTEEATTLPYHTVSAPYVELAKQIDNLQIREYESSTAETTDRSFRKWMRVVTADMLAGMRPRSQQSGSEGFTVGVSAGGSIMSYRKFRRNEDIVMGGSLPPPPSADEQFLYPFRHEIASGTGHNPGWAFENVAMDTSNLQSPDRQGEIHNRIIAEAYIEWGDSIFSRDVLRVDSLLRSRLAAVMPSGQEYFAAMTPQDTVRVSRILDVCETSNTWEGWYTGLTRLYPDEANELWVLRSILRRMYVLDIDADTGQFLTAAARLVRAADIPASSKQTIIASLSIANASVRLWNFNDSFRQNVKQ